MTIDFTDEQKQCINYGDGDLLIKGVPGSGKSYIILRRAFKLYNEINSALFSESNRKMTILIVTYTNTLVQYMNEMFEDAFEGERPDSEILEITTASKYFNKIYKTMEFKKKGNLLRFDETCCSDIIKEIIGSFENDKDINKRRFFKAKSEFWRDEFEWIKGRCITTLDDYLNANRKGRGSKIRFSTEDKHVAWNIYSLFCQKMKEKQLQLWSDLDLYLNENIENIPEEYKVDYVFVDEAQDMTLGAMRVLKAISRKSLTIAADMGQKIYKTSFTWKDAGINIQGRASKALKKSFRSTKQIVMLAEDLAKINRSNSNAKEEFTESVLPSSEGGLPEIFFCKTSWSEDNVLVNILTELLKTGSNKTIGLICKTKKRCEYYIDILKKHGFQYQKIAKNEKWKILEPGIKLVIGHSAKGLQFDIVIIPDLNNGIYPFFVKVEEGQKDEVETLERSLLYVDMTRAREKLIMICTERSASIFIRELSEEHYLRRVIK